MGFESVLTSLLNKDSEHDEFSAAEVMLSQ